MVIFLLCAILLPGCGGGNKVGGNGGENSVKNNAAENNAAPAVEEGEKAGEEFTGEVTVLAAASLTDAMNEMIELYNESQPKVQVNPSYASSGALQAQIEEGAPAHIFLSAADKQMDALEKENLIDPATRVELLRNEVVLIKPKDGKAQIKDFSDIANDTVKKIAIADPAGVPVGQYSEEIFTNLGNWDAVKAKMVMSQDVRNTLNWVATGEVDCGTVYKTDAFTEKDKVEIIATAPEGTHKPVMYPVAMIKDSAEDKAAKDFYQFIISEDGKKVFEKYGFTINQ